MLASDFTRDDCLVGKRRISYATLSREWRCGDCGGRLTSYYAGDPFNYDANAWAARCILCHGVDFIHERALARQRAEAIEVLAGLPPELAATLSKGD